MTAKMLSMPSAAAAALLTSEPWHGTLCISISHPIRVELFSKKGPKPPNAEAFVNSRTLGLYEPHNVLATVPYFKPQTSQTDKTESRVTRILQGVHEHLQHRRGAHTSNSR